MTPNITFVTAWYNFKCKFDISKYSEWWDDLLSNVNNFFLVLYTDDENKQLFAKYENNPNIKIIIRPYTDFYNWRYARQFEENHKKNYELIKLVDWKVNMLWCEKTHFVYDTRWC